MFKPSRKASYQSMPSLMAIIIMIDSEISDFLGDDPDILRLQELSSPEESLSLFLPPEEERQLVRLFFNVESSESQLNKQLDQRRPGNAYDITQVVLRPKRVSNTIFKTSLSQYRKSIIDEIKDKSQLIWLRKKLDEVYGAKNLSVFPKLNFMVRQLELQSQISNRWAQRSKQLLSKKTELMQKGRYQESRLAKLEVAIKIMNQCISEKDYGQVFRKYWGKYRQHEKHEQCKKEVDQFCKDFSKDVQNQKKQAKKKVSSSQKAKEKGTSLRRKRRMSETRDESTLY